MIFPATLRDAGFTLSSIDVRTADDTALAVLAAHEQVMEEERTPEDPPEPAEVRIAGWRNSPDFAEIACWVVRDRDGAIVTDAWTEIWHTGKNEHAIWFNIQVLPEQRRRGIARALLTEAASYTAQRNRTLLMTETTDRVPSGEAFMRRLDAEPGLPGKQRQLDLAAVNRELAQAWLTRGEQDAARYELGFLIGPYPDADMDSLLALHNVTWNSEPRGELDLEDENITAEQVREMERETAARGTERWTTYVRDRETGILVGDTEVFWNPSRPALVWQGFTGVHPEHQGQGLGRWLKADMLLRILRDRPQARHVRTGNADTNAPMLKINEELGFRLFCTEMMWQVKLDKVQAYLNAG
jgi:GNAT superfamily N-acetyltransferase